MSVWELPEQVSGVWTVDYSYGAVTVTAPFPKEGTNEPARYDAFVQNESAWLAYVVIRQGNGSSLLKRCNRPVKLSITHKFLAEFNSQVNVG